MLRKIEYATAIFLLVVQGFGCASDELTGASATNQPPKVWLAIGPPEGSVTTYRVQLHWGGWDPDGKVDHYEYAITDNDGGIFDPADTTGTDKWHRILRTDSIFALSADLVADSTVLDQNDRGPYEFERGHTFFVRAVDNEGMPSTKPAYRSFTSTTLSPDIYVTTPRAVGLNAALMPPTITFRWIATDYVDDDSQAQEPDSVRWILLNTTDQFDWDWRGALDHIRTHPDDPAWSPWHDYKAEADSGKFWTTEKPLPTKNEYLFAIQAKDEAGAVTPVFDMDRNVRRVYVAGLTTGPLVTLTYKYMKDLTVSTADVAPAILNIPAGLPVGFSWTADASSYGGNLQGYRYGWDIVDVAEPTEWETDLIPFIGSKAQAPSRTFYFGTHTFILEVRDNNDLVTRASAVVNIVPFTMQRNLLVVDDFVENSGGFQKSGGLLPSDEEHDAFWADVLSNIGGFAPSVDLFHIERGNEQVPIQILARYKNIIWDTRGSFNSTTGSALNEYIRFRHPSFDTGGDTPPLPNYVEMFMNIGGHLLIVGEFPMTIAISYNIAKPKYPFIYRYEATGDQTGVYADSQRPLWGIGEDSFAYHDYCLNVLDIAAIVNTAGVRRAPAACPVNTVRGYDQRTHGLRACNPIDATYNFPKLQLRGEVSWPGKWYAPDRLGVNVDIYNPEYFQSLCGQLVELFEPRACFQPMYALECLNTSSPVYGAPVAFWTSTHAASVASGSVPARSAVWGFEPALFNPSQVQEALEIILLEEWQLPRY